MYHPRSTPYGDVYTIPTSGIDNIAKMVYREQQVREQQKLQQDKALDDEFAKNVAGVKSADIPDITSAYNDFKQAHIALQKKGAKATPQDQMDVMIKKANAFQAINASKEEKEKVKNYILEGRADKKGKFIPTYQDVLTKRLNTPTSKIKEEDYDIKNHYSFPEMADFTKRILGTAKPKKIPLTTPSRKGELYDDKEVYQEFNNPNKMYEDAYIQGSSMGNKEGFINTMLDSLDDKEKEALKERYFAKVSSPEFKKIYGEVKPFPESAGRTDLGEATALMVMGMVDKLSLDPVDNISELNQDRANEKKRKEGMEDWLKKQKVSDQYKSARIRLNNEGRSYEIDNIPYKMKGDIKSRRTLSKWNEPPVEEDVIDITDYPSSYKDDILGEKKDKYGDRINKPIIENGREILKVTPDGYVGDNGYKVTDKDIYIRTNNRTVKLEKPVGTGKAEIRNDAPKVKSTTKSGLPVFHK